MENFVTLNFRELTGKIYHFKDLSQNDILIMALEKGHHETAILKSKYAEVLTIYKLL